MIYDEELFCYPFLISQVGMRQNAFILSPEFLLRSKDEFSSLLYTEVENKHIRNSFFRIAKYGSFIVFIYYWATTNTELNTGRGGLFVISGLMFRASDFIKNWERIRYFISSFYNVIHKLNDKDTKITNEQIIFEDSFKTSGSENVFQDQYCDNLWNLIQENDECIGRYVFENYQESYKNYYAEDKKFCRFFSSKDTFIFRKLPCQRSYTLQKLINKIAYKCRQVHFFKHNNKDCVWAGSMLLMENYSTEKSLEVFLQETNLYFRKHRFVFDVSTVEGLTLYTAIFIRGIEQIPFKAKKIKICKFDNMRYIKFFL